MLITHGDPMTFAEFVGLVIGMILGAVLLLVFLLVGSRVDRWFVDRKYGKPGEERR